MTERPKRIQRKRSKGYKMPSGAIYVGRPTKWGNPFPTALLFRWWLITGWPAEHLDAREIILRDLEELRGKDLACWCADGASCHADALLDYLEAHPAPEQTPLFAQ